MLLGVAGLLAGAAVMTAGPALAAVGSEPGHVVFSPASGATTSAPTWSTTDGCPTGHQGSAQMAIFDDHGVLLSRISPVAYNVTHPFKGTLDGSIAAITRFAQVAHGGTLDFAIGCWSLVGGTGSVTWVQSVAVTLSSSGTSYTSSAPSGQQQSASGAGANGTEGFGSGSSAGGGTGSNAASVAGSSASGGIGALGLAALISGACILAAGGAAFVWYRRRDRSRLM